MQPGVAQNLAWDKDYAVALDIWHGQSSASATALPLAMTLMAARAGDPNAFSSLVQQYYPAALRVARQILDIEEAALDAVQVAFIKAYHAMSRYQDGNFRAWLLRIVTNTCYDELRRQKRSRTVSLDALTEETNGKPHFEIKSTNSAHVTRDPEQAAVHAEAMQYLLMLIEELPAWHRQVVLLVDVDGYDYCEAAHLLQVPVGTVKSRLSRGRSQLRDRLIAAGHVGPTHRLQ